MVHQDRFYAYFATAQHALFGNDADDNDKETSVFIDHDQIAAEVVYEDAVDDITILAVPQHRCAGLTKLTAFAGVEQNLPIFFTGMRDPGSSITALPGRVLRCDANEVGAPKDEHWWHYCILDALTPVGFCGCPILNRAGLVVAMLCGNQTEELSYALRGEYINDAVITATRRVLAHRIQAK